MVSIMPIIRERRQSRMSLDSKQVGCWKNMFNSAQQKRREEEDRKEKGHVSQSWMDALGVGKWMPGSLQHCRGQDQSKMLVARALCAVLPNLH